MAPVSVSLQVGAVYDATSLPPKRAHAVVAGVYSIRCSGNDREYVGSSIDLGRRMRAHRDQLRLGTHRNRYLASAWNKYGEAAFIFCVLELTEPNAIIAAEQAWIERLAPRFNIGVCAENPMLGRKHSEVSRAKMSAALTGKKYGPRVFSEEHRAALSAAARRANPSARRPRTSAEKAMLSVAARKRLAALSVNPSNRPVEINGVTYESVKAAARGIGRSSSTIIARIAGGFARYLDEPSSGALKEWSRADCSGGKSPNAKAVIANQIRFATCRQAASHLGIAESTFTHWLRTGRAQFADGSPPPPPRIRRPS